MIKIIFNPRILSWCIGKKKYHLASNGVPPLLLLKISVPWSRWGEFNETDV